MNHEDDLRFKEGDEIEVLSDDVADMGELLPIHTWGSESGQRVFCLTRVAVVVLLQGRDGAWGG